MMTIAEQLGQRTEVRQVLNSEHFVDQAPRQVYATFLDEQQYLS